MSREKRLLLISSIFMAIYLILNLIYSASISKTYDNSLALDIFNAFVYGSSVLGIITFLSLSLKKNIKLEDYRGLIILISVLFFLYNIISGIIGFVALSKIQKKKKRELPVLEIQYNHKKYVYVFVFLICMGIMFGLSRLFTNIYQEICSYVFMFLLLVFTFKKDLKRDFRYFKEYFKEYSSYVFKMYLESLLVMFILSISIRLTTGIDNPTNQSLLNELFAYMPYYVIILALIYAPISEELMFRGCFRKVLKNKWLFIIISGLLFGLAHVIDDFKNIEELLYILLYGSLGCFLAAIYYRTNNIFCSMYFHFVQNAISVLAMILLSFLT